MSEIYKLTPTYKFIKKYITFSFKKFYSEFIVVGKENIPNGEPIIYAPNHVNALMDALAVHATTNQNQSLIFLARSDLFNNKIVAKILRYIKIMPAFRMRDGIENLNKNDHTFERCVDVLTNHHALGIMPEGNQGEQRNLRPFGKGIFRIAFAAQQKYGNAAGVKIIPIGIDLGNLTKFGDHIIIILGKPIEVSDYWDAYKSNPILAMNKIKARLKNDLNNITLNLETTSNYECFETIIEISKIAMLKKMKLEDSTINQFKAKQRIVEKLKTIEKNEPEKMNLIKSLYESYQVNIKSQKINSHLFENKNSTLSAFIIQQLYLFFSFPIFAYGFMLNIIPFSIPRLISKRMLKVRYSGFLTSIHYVLGIFIFPVFYIIQPIVVNSLFNLPTWLVLLIFIVQYPTGKFAFNWLKQSKVLCSEFKYRHLKRTKNAEINSIEILRGAIVKELVG